MINNSHKTEKGKEEKEEKESGAGARMNDHDCCAESRTWERWEK